MKKIKHLYVRTGNVIRPLSSMQDYMSIVAVDSRATVGYHDYSIEFLVNENKLIGIDRDTKEIIEDLSDKNLLRFGIEWESFKQFLSNEESLKDFMESEFYFIQKS